MKGFVVNIWLQTWSRIFGADVVKEMKKKYNVPDTFYNPLEDVPDELPVNMSRELASRKGITYEELWYKTGKENLKTFFEHYPEYFKKTSFLSWLLWTWYTEFLPEGSKERNPRESSSNSFHRAKH